MQIHSVVFALSRHINKKKYAKTINRLCTGNKVLLKYEAQGVNPKVPPFVRPWYYANIFVRQDIVSFVPPVVTKKDNTFISLEADC